MIRWNLTLCSLVLPILLISCGRHEPKQAQTSLSQANSASLVEELKWLPDDVEVVIRVRPQDILRSSAIENLKQSGVREISLLDKDNFKFPLDESHSIDAEEIATVTIGFTDRAAEELQANRSSADPAEFAVDSLLIIEMTENFPLDSLSEKVWRRKEFSEKSYLEQVTSYQDFGPLALFQPHPKLLLVGAATIVRDTIDRATKQSASSLPQRFRQIDPLAHIAVGLAPRDISQIRQMQLPVGLPEDFRSLFETLQRSMQAVSLQVNLTDSTHFQLGISCQSDESAKTLKQLVSETIMNWQAIAESKFADRTEFGFFEGLLQQIVEHLSLTQTGTLVSVQTSIPEEMTTGILSIAANEFGGATKKLTSMTNEPRQRFLPATSLSGVPDGTEMVGTVRWSSLQTSRTEQSTIPPPQLEALIALNQGFADRIVEFGEIQISEALTDTGELKRANTLFAADTIRDTVVFYRSGWTVPTPETGIAFPVTFHYPPAESTQITSLSGEMKVVTFESSLEKTITPTALIRKNPDDKDLRDVGFRVRKLPPTFKGDPESFAISVSSSAAISKAIVLDNQQQPITEAWTESRRLPGGRFQLTVNTFDSILPDNFQLRFKLHKQLASHQVSFEFNDIPIPPVPFAVDDEQIASDLWKHSTVVNDSIRVEAKANWGLTHALNKDGSNRVRPLHVNIDLTGSAIHNPVALGRFNVSTATAGDSKLELLNDSFGEFERMQNELVAYEPFWHSAKLPVDGMQAVLMFEPPSKDVEQIDSLKGDLTIVFAADRKQIFVDDLTEFLDTTIQHPILKEMDLPIHVRQFGDGIVAALPEDQPFAIAEMLVLDEFGGQSRKVYAGRQSFDGTTVFSFDGEDKLSKPLPVRITVNQSLQERPIPFEFRDLKIPERPSD